MRRAELLGIGQLVVQQVGGGDDARPGEPRALNDVQPHAAAADDEDGGARLHLGAGVTAPTPSARSSRPARPAATASPSAWAEHLRRAHYALGEGADARHLVDVLPLVLQAIGPVEHAPARRGVAVAQDAPPDRAVETAPAMRPEREDDVVAGHDVGHARADLLDDARRLVAEHHGKRRRPVTVHDVPVAVADARGLHLHAGLAGARALLGQIHDLEGVFALKRTAAFMGVSFPGSRLGLRGDGDHLDLHGGRHGDRAVEGSAVLPGRDQVVGLRLLDAAQLELHVDGLEPVGSALLRTPSITACMLWSGMPLSAAYFSMSVTPHEEMPARKASPLVTASLGPEGESRMKCWVRAVLSDRPSTPLLVERTVSILTPSAMAVPRWQGGVGWAARSMMGLAPEAVKPAPCEAVGVAV